MTGNGLAFISAQVNSVFEADKVTPLPQKEVPEPKMDKSVIVNTPGVVRVIVGSRQVGVGGLSSNIVPFTVKEKLPSSVSLLLMVTVAVCSVQSVGGSKVIIKSEELAGIIGEVGGVPVTEKAVEPEIAILSGEPVSSKSALPIFLMVKVSLVEVFTVPKSNIPPSPIIVGPLSTNSNSGNTPISK